MKDTHKYNNNFTEYQKAIQFLEKGCECGCSATLSKERFAILRDSFQKLTFLEKDAFVMGQLTNTKGGDMTASSRFPKRERLNQRHFYIFEYKKPICQETFLNMLGVSRKYLENLKKHLTTKGLSARVHGNTGKIPFRKTKMFIDETDKKRIKNFIEKLAETRGLPDPGRTKRITQSIVYLPTEMSYASVRRDFLTSLRKGSKLKQLNYDVFRRLWHELTPNIKFRSPRSDLCDTCQKFHRDLQYSCLDKETKKKI
jgi:hypothetical protein